MTELADILSDLGVDIHKTHGDEINGRCPVHHKVKGRESSRNSWYINVETGLWHCFTCGARGNLNQLLSELAGDPMALWRAQKLIIQNGLRKLEPEEKERITYKQDTLDWMSFLSRPKLPQPILCFRHVDADVAERYGVRWDPDMKAMLLPIVDPGVGDLVGYQAKKSGWVRNLPEGVNKSLTLFGYERAKGDSVVLLESPMDVVRFHTVVDDPKVSAVASFGANVSSAQIRLLEGFDRVILALDNDLAGEKETERLSKLIGNKIWYWNYGPDDPKDLGEMTDGQIVRGLANVGRVHVRSAS